TATTAIASSARLRPPVKRAAGPPPRPPSRPRTNACSLAISRSSSGTGPPGPRRGPPPPGPPGPHGPPPPGRRPLPPPSPPPEEPPDAPPGDPQGPGPPLFHDIE